MDQGNVLPRGGFTRGMLAGTTFVLVVFVTVSTLFPLPTFESDSVVAAIPEGDPFSALVSSQFGAGANTDESVSVGLVAPSITSSPSLTPVAPSSFNAPTSGIAPSSGESAPVSGVALSAPATSLSPVTLERLNETAPLIEVPIVPIDSTASITAPSVSVETEVAGVAIPAATASTQTSVQPTNLTSNNTSEAIVASGETVAAPVGGFQDAGQGIASPTETTGSSEVSNTSSGPAFETYSVTFTDFVDNPYISIILLVDTVEQVEAVIGLGSAITLAVMADNANSQEIITSYRRNGGEVLLMLPNDGLLSLRKGGDPAQVADMLSVLLQDSAGVVGIMDGPSGDLNQDSNMVNAVLATLADTGHAFITTTSIGLNRAEDLTKSAGIYGTTITRHIDSAPGKVTVIRAMDRAILQIDDSNSNAVFGYASSDTIAALSFWQKSRKAQSITIAPISASILRN